MLNRPISGKSVVIILYMIGLAVFGLLLVPHYEVWGPDKEITGYYYHTIFSLVEPDHTVNGFIVYYQIDYVKQLTILGVWTALCASVWLLLSQWEKEDRRTKETNV